MTAALGLSAAALLAAVGLLALSAATARPVRTALPDRAGYFDLWSQLHGGYDPRSSAWARGWLGIAHTVSRPLAARGVLPDVLTLWGLWAALAVLPPAAAGGRWAWLATVVVVVSGLVDNIDGCVAVLTGRSTRFGFVLDSVVDRVADLLYLVALWLLGAPVAACIAAGVLLGLLEYTRARATGAGMAEVAVVTIGERPTRVVLAAFTFLAAGSFASYAGLAAGAGAAATALVTGVGLVQLLAAVHRRLSAAATP